MLGVPDGSPIGDVADLEEPGVTVAVGDPEVPVGAYTRKVLDALGEGESNAILDNVASSEPDVAGIVGKLNQGAVDAGFVYLSDVAASDGASWRSSCRRTSAPTSPTGSLSRLTHPSPSSPPSSCREPLTVVGRRSCSTPVSVPPPK